MIPEERDLRRALEARSGEPSPQFRARLTSAFDEGRPASGLTQAVAAFAVVAITLGTVSVLMLSRNARNAGPVGEPLYTVNTMLLSVKEKQPLRACYLVLASLPPAGCSGVDVENVDPEKLPGFWTYPNGIVETAVVKLVGTWDGHVLHITEPPVPTKESSISKPVSHAPPAGLKNANIEDIRRDEAALREQGIVVLATYGDPGPAVDLAVADAKSVQYIYDHYGSVKISGWLQPFQRVIETPKPSPLPTPSPTTIPMPTTVAIIPSSENTVWVAVANQLLFRSTNKGDTWERRPWPPLSAGGGNPSFSFIDDRQGWVMRAGVAETQCNGQSATVLHTSDGATTWQQVSSVQWSQPAHSDSVLGYGQCKETLTFVDSNHGFLTAWDPNHRPTVYRTADGGKTWSKFTLSDPPDFVTQGGFTLHAGRVKKSGNTLLLMTWGAQSGEIPDRQYIYRSTDGGATWSWYTKVPSRYIALVTETRWLQLVVPGQSDESTNGGQQWHPYESDFNTDTPAGGPQIVFATEWVGYAEGRGALQRTTDGGRHWTRIATPGTDAQ